MHVYRALRLGTQSTPATHVFVRGRLDTPMNKTHMDPWSCDGVNRHFLGDVAKKIKWTADEDNKLFFFSKVRNARVTSKGDLCVAGKAFRMIIEMPASVRSRMDHVLNARGAIFEPDEDTELLAKVELLPDEARAFVTIMARSKTGYHKASWLEVDVSIEDEDGSSSSYEEDDEEDESEPDDEEEESEPDDEEGESEPDDAEGGEEDREVSEGEDDESEEGSRET